MKTYLRLLKYLKPYIWPYFTLGLLCMIGFGATDGVLPGIVGRRLELAPMAKVQPYIWFAGMLVCSSPT